MAYLALFLALLAVLAAAFLWRLDAKQRAAAEPSEQPAEPAEPAEIKPEPEPEPEAEPEEPIEAEVIEDDPEPEPAPDPEPAPEQEPEPTPEPEPKRSAPHRTNSIHLPGSTRRERRSWAEARGFGFARTDDYLVDEWSRGAAATGAPARDIVTGEAYGHEMLLMDLDGVNVMAISTGSQSDEVIDFRRKELVEGENSTDLLRVEEVEDFAVFATEIGVARRLIDVRVRTALATMPSVVTAVWMESDWVLAQTVRATKTSDWEEMLAPLAMLADAARVLPPRSSAEHALNVAEMTPSRRMPEVAPSAPAARDRHEDLETVVAPPVRRPEEPLELPSRTQGEAYGVVEPRAIGGDDIDPIADGENSEAPSADGARIPRKRDHGPSIFGDGAE